MREESKEDHKVTEALLFECVKAQACVFCGKGFGCECKDEAGNRERIKKAIDLEWI